MFYKNVIEHIDFKLQFILLLTFESIIFLLGPLQFYVLKAAKMPTFLLTRLKHILRKQFLRKSAFPYLLVSQTLIEYFLYRSVLATVTDLEYSTTGTR